MSKPLFLTTMLLWILCTFLGTLFGAHFSERCGLAVPDTASAWFLALGTVAGQGVFLAACLSIDWIARLLRPRRLTSCAQTTQITTQ